MTNFPARGQQAPNFWDDQLQAWISEQDAAVSATAAAAATTAVIGQVGPTIDGLVTQAASLVSQESRLKNAPALNIYFPEAFGAVQDGSTDSTAAFQAAVDALPRGGRLYLKGTSTNGIYYKLTSTVVIRNSYIILMSDMVSHTTSSIRGVTPNMDLFRVDAPGVYFRDIAFVGDGTPGLRNGTTVGIRYRGPVLGDVDAVVRDCTFVWLKTGIVNHARNLVVQTSLFGEITQGIDYRGLDTSYHATGDNRSAVNRGNVVRGCRFHGIGNSSADFCIRFSGANMDSRWAVVEDNDFDMFNDATSIVALGTATSRIKMLTCTGNRHHESGAPAYHFTYAEDFIISDARVAGIAGSGWPANGIMLVNCTSGRIDGLYINRMGASGLYARNCSGIDIANVMIKTVGIDNGVVGHGFDVDDSNSNLRFRGNTVDGADGYGFTGSPTGSEMTDCQFRNCTLGRIASTTLAEETIWVPGNTMSIVNGTPANVNMNSYMVMALDPATTEQVSAFVEVPRNWVTFAVEVWVAPTDANAGNVRVQAAATTIVDGAELASGTVGVLTLALNTGIRKAQKATAINTVTNPLSGGVGVRVARLGADALDTYAADIGLLGVRLVRTA